MRWLAFVCAMFLAGCGGGPPKTPLTEADAGETGPTFEIEPATFLPLPEFTATKKAELSQSGVIFADGKEVGHIKGGVVFVEGTGEWGTLKEDGSLVAYDVMPIESLTGIASLLLGVSLPASQNEKRSTIQKQLTTASLN